MNTHMDTPTIFLVDGSNYLYRAYYAIRELSTSRGFPTNAIYGFTVMLLKLLKEWKPQYIAVVFDVKGPTFRHESFENYKATRRETPEPLITQIPHIKDIIRAFSIPVLEMPGMEADDIIGTLAKKFAQEGMNIVIVSGDKDLMQLISDNIIMIDTMKDKIYNRDAVKERFGVYPEKVVDVLALTGDVSDNIPGVPGIGPKSAQRLIEEFGSLENILNNREKIRNQKIREAIRNFAEQALLSRELASIKIDVDCPVDLSHIHYSGPNKEELRELFKKFEFSSLLKELDLHNATVEGDYRLVLTESDLQNLIERVQQTRAFAFDFAADAHSTTQLQITGLSMCTESGEAVYIPLAHNYIGVPQQLKTDTVLKKLTPLFVHKEISKLGHDVKSAIILLSRHGVELNNIGFDTMVASYILNPARHGFELADVVREHLNKEIVTTKDLVGKGAKARPYRLIPLDEMKRFMCQRTDAILSLAKVLSQKIKEEGFHDLYYNVELPLVSVLAAMELRGVLVDVKLLKEISLELEQLMTLTENRIYELAGEKFNIHSPKQLQKILFEKLGLPRGRKTKEGYSTDMDVLTHLALSHELPAEILAYRSMAKLKSTYVDALPQLINPVTGRIHTSYNQTVTATGRLSSSNPNLQNIPARTPEGKRIRQAFIAPEDWEIVSADYSQIELRILAHLSEDQALIEAFAQDTDIHTATASHVFGVFPEMVTPEMRRQAKVINFGILYGMSAFGLAKELNIPQKQAQTYIDEYFNRFQGVRSFLDSVLENARRNGFVTTLFNRRRYLPEINSDNITVRQFAERMAINTPIQGSAADLIKVAMINIFNRFSEKHLSSRMIMQVHDELVFEVPIAEKEEVIPLIRKEMEEVIQLKVPLKVDIASGKNWDEAHG